MAIDRVQEFALAFAHRSEDAVLTRLFDAGIAHLTSYTPPEGASADEVPASSPDVCRLQREESLHHVADELELANATLSFFAEVDPATKGLVQSFFPDEVYVSASDMRTTASMGSSSNYADMMRSVLALKVQLVEQRRRLSKLEQDIAAMAPWSSLPVDFGEVVQWRRIALATGTISPLGLARVTRILSDHSIPVAVETLTETKNAMKVIVGCLRSQADDVRALLTSEGFVEQDLSGAGTTVAAFSDRLTEERRVVHDKVETLRLEVASYLARRQEIVVYREYLLNERKRLEGSNDVTRTEHCSVVTGYVREADIKSLELLCSSLGGIVCMTGDPTGGDSTPVSITNNKWLRPLEILINMFGFPVYSSFDPTVYLAIPFLVFFGLCLGDVLYGAIQIGICLYFIRKYRQSTGVRNFMTVFVYGGAAAMVAGVLTGSWGGDLVSATYLGAGNPIARFVAALTIINPLQAAFQFLVIVWILGAMNQLYGVCLAILKAVRRHDYATILYDCVGWLLFLPAISALLFIGTKWGGAFRIGYLTALAIGLALLLLGGARQSKGGAKVLTALVNLYGIQSSYGVGSFVGDVLSYSRLLALGLTTAILASAFNMIAALIQMPAAGFIVNLLLRVVFGGAILLFGHMLNYFMGAMGAFIHAARLILLEFFGRFYEGGAPRFHRFGFSSEVVKIVDTSAVQGK
ncbi:MAG: V-type ATP synthase subunit I [Candidatus Cryosericum sp.]